MTSLSKQLQQLQSRPDGDQHLAKSFLFSNSDAKQISREQIYELATSGLRTLMAIDNRFAPFLEPLFGSSTVRQERAKFTSAQNKETSEKIQHVCALLSPHLFVMAAQQVFEYLVRVYEVHTYDVNTVLSMFLPYHDHAIFGRVLMLLDLRGTGFDFLKQNQESGTILPRPTLVMAASENMKVMRLLCTIAADTIKYEVTNNAAFALLAGVATAASIRPENEAVLRVLLPFLVSFVEDPHPVATPTAILIMCVWSQEGSMSAKALAALVRPLVRSLSWSQFPVTLSERLAALGHVFKFQGTAIYSVEFSPILDLMVALPLWGDWWASQAVPQTATAALTHRLLDYCLIQLKRSTLVSGVVVEPTAIEFLRAACEHMNGLGQSDIVSLFNCFVSYMSQHQKLGDSSNVTETSATLASCLKGLERRYPLLMDEAISSALAKAMRGDTNADDEPTTDMSAAPSYDALIHFISVHFSGTKYELIDIPAVPSGGATRKAPLLTCLLHQVAEVRRVAFNALRHRVEGEAATASNLSLINEMTMTNVADAEEKKKQSNMLPLIRHAMEVETSDGVAKEALSFAHALVKATFKAAGSSSSFEASVASLLSSLWTMVSSAMTKMEFVSSSSSALASFVDLLSVIIAHEKSKGNATAPTNKKKKVRGPATKGLIASTDNTDVPVVATAASSPAPTPLLSQSAYYLTVAACVETGLSGTTLLVSKLFSELGLATPASGFVVAPNIDLNANDSSNASATAAAADSSDSDDEEKKKPKRKVGEAAAPQADSKNNKNKSAIETLKLTTSFTPDAIFSTASSVPDGVVGVIASAFPMSSFVALADAWAARRSLLGCSVDCYATFKTEGIIQKNMLAAHIAESAVLAAVAAVKAVTASSEVAAMSTLSKVIEVTAVPASEATTYISIPTCATALGVSSGFSVGLHLLNNTTDATPATSPISNTQSAAIANIITLIVTRFKQSVPCPVSNIPSSALWALTTMSCGENEKSSKNDIVSSKTDVNSSGVIRVSTTMATSSTLNGLPTPSTVHAGNHRLGYTRRMLNLVKGEGEMQASRSEELFTAIAECIYGDSILNKSNNKVEYSRDVITFALLFPTMAPSSGLRQAAVEKLQSAVLKASSSSSFIACAIRQLTSSAALSVTAVNSLVEVLAIGTSNSCLTDDMAVAVLKLLLDEKAVPNTEAAPLSLSPSYLSNAINSLFAHNKRSIQKHGNLVLSKLLPIFIRPTIAKASTAPLSAGEGDLLFTCTKLVSFVAATAASLEATCEVVALSLKRGGVRIFNPLYNQKKGNNSNVDSSLMLGANRQQEIIIRSLFVPVLAALSAVTPKLLSTVASNENSSHTFVGMVLTPSRLLLELLVPLYERSGAVTSDPLDSSTAAQHVVSWLTTTTVGFSHVLTPVLPTAILSLGEMVNNSTTGDNGNKKEDSRKVGKKTAGRANGDAADENNNNAVKKSATNYSQLVDLATEVVAYLGTGNSNEGTASGGTAGAMMADGAASTVLAQIAEASGSVNKINMSAAVLDGVMICRLFRAAFTALQSLPSNAAEVEAAKVKAAKSPNCTGVIENLTATKVNLLKFISILIVAAPASEGFVRENTDGKTLDRMLVASEAAADLEEEKDNADGNNINNNTSESALAYILRTFEMSLLTPFLLGHNGGANDEANNKMTTATVSFGAGDGQPKTNISLMAGASSIALTLTSTHLIRTLITTMADNSVALCSGQRVASHDTIVVHAKHRLIRQSLLLLSSLFVHELNENEEGKDVALQNTSDLLSFHSWKASAANTLVAVVSQLLHVIGPLLSGANATAAKKKKNKNEDIDSDNNKTATLGAVTSLLHIPLMSLYLALDAAAAARQAVLAAENSTVTDGKTLLADGGADYYVSSSLLETPINICVKILTSFHVEEQMAALCGIMEMVCDAKGHLARVSAAAAHPTNDSVSGTTTTHSNVVAELCSRLIRSNRIADRQEPILNLIALTLKSGAFLSPFIELQNNDLKRRSSKTNSVTGVDAATGCANLMVAALNMYSHYHNLNAKTLVVARQAAAGNKSVEDNVDAADLSDLDDDDVLTEERAFTTLLELLAGNSLACVLASINEPTFIDCQSRMLTSSSYSLRQKGLEALLDRLQQSLPTVEDDRLSTSQEARAAAAKDPRVRTDVLHLLQLRARPQTTALSANLLPMLFTILKQSMTTEGLFSITVDSKRAEAMRVAQQQTIAAASKRTKASVVNATAVATAATLADTTPSQKELQATVQVALGCVEELVRIIGAGGSGKAESTLSKPQLLGVGGGGESTIVTEHTLTRYFKSKQNLDELHAMTTFCLDNVFEWVNAVSMARRGIPAKAFTPQQQVLLTALVCPTRSHAQQKQSFQSLLVLIGSCLNMMATVTRTLSVVFVAPHSNNILKVIASTMSVTMNILSSSGGAPLSAKQVILTPNSDNMFLKTTHGIGNATLYLFSSTLGGNSNNTSANSVYSETVNYLRRVLLNSIHFALPNTWMMAHPYIPTFVSFATHNCNVNDPETVETSASFLSSLRAVLGDRGMLECICSALIYRRNVSSHDEVVVAITPTTHSIRLIFIFVERMISEMTKDEISSMPILITGCGADEVESALAHSSVAGGAAASSSGKNFWLAAFGALANQGALPSAEAMASVFDAYTAFFVKYKEKTCAQFWTTVTDWATNRQAAIAQQQQQQAAAAGGGDEADEEEGGATKRYRGEAGGYSGADASASTSTDIDGYSKQQIAVHFVYLNLYSHLLRRLKSIMAFSFPIVSNVLVEFLQRYNPTPFVNFSTAISGGNTNNKSALSALASGVASDNTGGAWILKAKGLRGIIFATTNALMSTIFLMSEAQIPEDPTLAARTGVAFDVYFSKVDVFNTIMPLVVSQLANTHVFSYELSVGADSSSLGFYKRAEKSIVPAIRKYFAAINGPKLWSLTQKEMIKYLRHPKASVRRATLLLMQLCYRDGGDALCSFIMAEGLPAIVEMTEDNDKEVVEQARLLCSELSTITGQDVLHAMA